MRWCAVCDRVAVGLDDLHGLLHLLPHPPAGPFRRLCPGLSTWRRQGFGFWVLGVGFWVLGLGVGLGVGDLCRGSGLKGAGVQGSRIQGSELRVHGAMHCAFLRNATVLPSSYVVCGTDVSYGATILRNVRY